MVRLLSVVFLSFAVCGCATQAEHYFSPPVSAVVKKNVGESIVKEGWGIERDCSTIEIKYGFLINKKSWPRSYDAAIPAGIYTRHTSSIVPSGQQYYSSQNGIPVTITSRITQKKSTDHYDFYIVFDDQGRALKARFKVGGLNFDIVGGSGAVIYERAKKTCYDDMEPVYGVTSFLKRELLYNGVTGSVVHLSYREFFNDFARAAFSQDLVYDLEKSDVIGFKGMRIRVHSADNTAIEYEILSYFN